MFLFPQAMNYIVVSLLCDQFEKLNKEFSKCIGDRGEFHGNFEQFRRRHQTISHSVKEADRFLMISNFACFCCHIVGIILVLFCSIFYRQVTVSYNAVGAFMYSFWLVTNVFGLLLAASLAIFVTNKVTRGSFSNIETVHKADKIRLKQGKEVRKFSGTLR